MNGDFFHDAAYLITGIIIWPVACVAGFLVGIWKYVILRKQ